MDGSYSIDSLKQMPHITDKMFHGLLTRRKAHRKIKTSIRKKNSVQSRHGPIKSSVMLSCKGNIAVFGFEQLQSRNASSQISVNESLRKICDDLNVRER